MQIAMFTVFRRYSQGVLKENYSKMSQSKQIAAFTLHILAWSINDRLHSYLLLQDKVLLIGKVIKMIYSAYKVSNSLDKGKRALPKLWSLLCCSAKI
jgi:hypothetical protein